MSRLLSIVAVVFVTICSLRYSTTSYAASFDGLGLAPGPSAAYRDQSGFHYRLDPGQTISDTLKVLNTTAAPKHIQLVALPATITADNRLVCPPTSSNQADLVHISRSSLVIGGNAVELIPFSLAVPSTLTGEYNVCLVGQEISNTQTGAIPLTSRLAMRLSITTNVKPDIAIRISGLKTTTSDNSLTYTGSLKNDSTVSLSATSVVTLSGLFMRQTHATTRQLLLPKAETTLHGTFKRPLVGGWYRLTVRSTAQQAISSWSRVSGQSIQSDMKTVFIWPHAGLIIGAGSVAGILIALKTKKSRQKRD